MEIARITQTLQQDALSVVFINVLLQQIGLPVPAVPTLLVAGSLAAGPGQLGPLLGAAILASVLADWAWYGAGRRFGYRVLSGLCRLSLNPASCVHQTEARFVRWGVSSLVVAKFIPGFSTVAPPIAGALRMRQSGFLAAAAVGAGLWAGAALGAGWALRDSVQGAIALLDAHAGRALLAALLAVGAWLAWKLAQQYRFRQLAPLASITPAELRAALASARRPLVLDLRGAALIEASGPLCIPGLRVAEHDALSAAVADWPKNQPIVTLCACPEDAGAIQAARRLLKEGYLSVKPLRGGYEAWLAASPDPAPPG